MNLSQCVVVRVNTFSLIDSTFKVKRVLDYSQVKVLELKCQSSETSARELR